MWSASESSCLKCCNNTNFSVIFYWSLDGLAKQVLANNQMLSYSVKEPLFRKKCFLFDFMMHPKCKWCPFITGQAIVLWTYERKSLLLEMPSSNCKQ